MAEFPFQAPQLITAAHSTQTFDCGKAPLNEFLQLHALTNSQSGNSRTFIVADTAHADTAHADTAHNVVGYYSLAATSIAYEAAPERVKQGQPRYPIPAILMARFAVDHTQQGKGLGRALFRDALLRSLNITQELGARAFVVDAKDEDALRFYQQFNMMVEPSNALRLYLLFKDVKKILAG